MDRKTIKVGIVIIALIIFGYLAAQKYFFAPQALQPVKNSTSTSPAVTNPSSTPTSTQPEGTVTGQVVVSPTCPVERTPPDPSCAPRPYQTSVGISKNIETPENSVTVDTNASGTFNVSLPAGEYVFHPVGGSPYPRCDEKLVKVSAGNTNNVVINCDTGIR